MKKNIISVCALLLVTLFMFVSCSGSITDTLLKVMDGTKTNVFEQAGLVKPDTSAADNMMKSLETKPTEIAVTKEGTDNYKVNLASNDQFKDALKALEGTGVSAEIKLSEDLAAFATKALAPQTSEQKKTYSESISKIYSQNSDSAFDAAEAKFKTEVTDPETVAAVKGSMAIASGLIDNVTTKVGSTSDIGKALDQISKEFKEVAQLDGPITEGDKATAQLVTNVAVSAAAASSVLADSSKTIAEKMEDPAVKEFINDANVLYNTSKLAAGSIDITKSGIFELLMEKTDSNSKAVDVNVGEMPDKYKKLIPSLVKSLLGTNPDQYRTKIRSLKAMVNARNVAFAVVTETDTTKIKASEYANLKNQASLGSVVEYITAAAVVQLDNVLVDKGTTFLDVAIDVVKTSGPEFFNGLEVLKASEKNVGLVEKLFSGSDSEIKSVMSDVFKNVKTDAITADKMLTVGGSSVGDLLELMKIQSSEGQQITSISAFIDKLIADMNKNN